MRGLAGDEVYQAPPRLPVDVNGRLPIPEKLSVS